jgi:hypothetical protein
MSHDPGRRYLPVRIPSAGLPHPGFTAGDSLSSTFRGLAVPRRLARLGTVLAFASLVFVCVGLGGWAALGTDLGEGADGRGPWPLVLGAAFCMGLLGAGCGLVALGLGNAARRQAVSALCVSLVAPLAVGIIALGLFFSSTGTSFGFGG